MPDPSGIDAAPSWLQFLSVSGFAGLVYLELRVHRAELKAMNDVLARMGELLAVLLDRARAPRVLPRERTAPIRAATAPVVVVEPVDDENPDA